MQNVGGEAFDYGTFKAAYDTDERVKSMVQNFSNKGIEPKTKQNIKDKEVSKPAGSDTVGAMAKRATDLGDDIGEGLKSPHKKGSRKYKKQLAAKHAAMAARQDLK